MISVCIATYNGQRFIARQLNSILCQLSADDEVVVADDGSTDDAKGDYIFLSDQDDEWMPEKVEVTMRYLQQYDCVVSDNTVVSPDGQIIAPSFYAVNGTKSGRLYNLLVKNGYLGCCMAFRRNVLEASLPFPADIPMHDIWIGNVAAFRYTVCFIPEKLMTYNRHGDNASSASSPSAYSTIEKLRFRWVVVRDLMRLKR